MASEIEIKIPLTDNEYDRLLGLLKEGTGAVGKLEHIIKKDEYYSRYDSEEERKASDEPRVIRIRTEKTDEEAEEKRFFCFKFKTIQNGMEFNSENESFVQNGAVLSQFLEISGYKKYFEKCKEAWSQYYEPDWAQGICFHGELVNVNGHKYMETEVTDSPQDPQLVQERLEKFITGLGLDVSKKDSRSWMEIIKASK